MLDKDSNSFEKDDEIVSEEIESLFDNKKLNKSIRKVKIKSTTKIIFISVIVFIVVYIFGNYLNMRISLKYSSEAYNSNEANVKLSIPNGYISQSNDTFGFLGGSGTYKMAKVVGGRPIILADRESTFGVKQPMKFNRTMSGGGGIAQSGGNNIWPVSLWDNGYKRMRFFHPEFKYKEYQNDLENIDEIPDGKVIEMAISFDKPYKINDMFIVSNKLKPATITWLWLDEFTKKNMEKIQFEIDNLGDRGGAIEEFDAIGINRININGIAENEYNQSYDEVVDYLSKSPMINHKELYNEIMERGKTKAEDAKVLGVVVQGTKEELQKLVGNPIIKASVVGIVVDPLY